MPSAVLDPARRDTHATEGMPIPALEILLSRAGDLRTTLRERARDTERERRVSAATTKLLADAGLYRVVQPRRFGGYEMALTDLMQLAFAVGQGCGSTGWCYALGATQSWFLGMFPLQAQEDVWGDAPDALVAGSIAPTGKARRVPGGYQVHGRWGFASNCDNAGWATLGAMLEDAEGQPRPIFVLVPAGDYRIIDNWDTVGLAGTGSKDIVIESELFVPEHRSVTFAAVLNQEAPGAAASANPMYRIPFLSGFPPMLAIPAVAALKGAVDEFVESIGTRSTRGAFVSAASTLGQFGHVQSAVAQADAAVDAAQLILQRDLQQAARLAAAGEKLTAQQRIENRRGHAYAVRLCVGGINGLFEVVGGTGIQMDGGVQRAWRDIHAVAHHISTNWHAVSTMAGQQRLGLPPRGQF